MPGFKFWHTALNFLPMPCGKSRQTGKACRLAYKAGQSTTTIHSCLNPTHALLPFDKVAVLTEVVM